MALFRVGDLVEGIPNAHRYGITVHGNGHGIVTEYRNDEDGEGMTIQWIFSNGHRDITYDVCPRYFRLKDGEQTTTITEEDKVIYHFKVGDMVHPKDSYLGRQSICGGTIGTDWRGKITNIDHGNGKCKISTGWWIGLKEIELDEPPMKDEVIVTLQWPDDNHRVATTMGVARMLYDDLKLDETTGNKVFWLKEPSEPVTETASIEWLREHL